jgi:hypothetical protein
VTCSAIRFSLIPNQTYVETFQTILAPLMTLKFSFTRFSDIFIEENRSDDKDQSPKRFKDGNNITHCIIK